jgi:hypothetical protein
MSDIVMRLRAMAAETGWPIFSTAANAFIDAQIERKEAEAERDAALWAVDWLRRVNANPWQVVPIEHAAVIEAARKLGGE